MEMGCISGAHNLPWLFSVVFVTMLAVIPIFGWVAGHFTIRRLLPTVYAFFILNLLVFFVALQSGIGLQAFGPIFFVWLSVFNLFVVSVFWSFMADVFPTDGARRLFGCISAGGSLGAMTGPFITAMAVKGVGVSGLLLVSAMFLFIAVGCMLALLKWYHSHHGVDLGNRHLSSIKILRPSPQFVDRGPAHCSLALFERHCPLSHVLFNSVYIFVFAANHINSPGDAKFRRPDAIVRICGSWDQCLSLHSPVFRDRMVVNTVWCRDHVGRHAHGIISWIWGVWFGNSPAGLDWVWCAAEGRGIFHYQADTGNSFYRRPPGGKIPGEKRD